VNRRVLLFFLLSFIVIQLTVWWSAPPVQEPGADEQAEKLDAEAADDAGAPDEVADEVADEKADAGPAGGKNEEAAPPDADGEPAADAPEGEVPTQLITLGSIDEASGYRMLVTLTNEGAAVKRAELASSRYLDLHDLTGYLGHLEVVADGGRGLLVQAVGNGTPAAAAGPRARRSPAPPAPRR